MLVLEGVKKDYGSLTALAGLSLTIERGEVFGLLGPNGAGKTTTMGIATGLIRPDAGRVDVNGAGPPASAAVRRHVGLCPQEIALYDKLTARENIAFFAGVAGLSRREARERGDAALDRVGLLDRAASRVETFSGGMKRRLNLAVAVVHRPALVLLDEPTAGVDPHSRSAIFDIVASLKAEGVTVVYTTHYMEEAQRLCDRVGIIDHGRLLDVGTVDQLIARHGGHTVVTITRGPDRTERIESARPVEVLASLRLDQPGGEVTSVRLDPPDLESVFLSLTGRSLRDH